VTDAHKSRVRTPHPGDLALTAHEPAPAEVKGWMHRVRSVLPHGGSLPENEWRRRNGVIVGLLWAMIAIVAVYAWLSHGADAIRYVPETVALLSCAWLAGWTELSRKWRSIAASLGLLTAAASLVDISGGLTEMHFTFFVVVVLLTLYEDWIPFLIAVGFVLVHHGVMGTIDPQAVFAAHGEWRHPWLWAGIHATFIALAGAVGVVAWKLNEQVRDRMRATQRELSAISLTDPLTGLLNRRSLMLDLQARSEDGCEAVLAIFDLDGFKDYNDRFGHPSGDRLLICLSARLRASVGQDGRAYRIGGDEFCVVADGSLLADVDRSLATWAAALAEHGEGFSISASSGVASLPGDGATPSEVLTISDDRMYARKSRRRANAATQSRNVLLAALGERYEDLSGHATAVATWAEQVGAQLGLDRSRLPELLHAAELHDIGKLAISESIIAKPGPLDDEEWELVRHHTIIGERILAASPALARVAQIVRSSHERFDGCGYPDGVADTAIPLESRIINVCHAYDAMLSERPYQPASSPRDALAELWRCAGTQFDPEVVRAFARVIGAGACSDPGERSLPGLGQPQPARAR
jgi:diguanylate cyclase (GGDEF)-like protein